MWPFSSLNKSADESDSKEGLKDRDLCPRCKSKTCEYLHDSVIYPEGGRRKLRIYEEEHVFKECPDCGVVGTMPVDSERTPVVDIPLETLRELGEEPSDE